jgi:hypothetical protein
MQSRALTAQHVRSSGTRTIFFLMAITPLVVPSLARAQVTLPFKDVLFVERGIRSYPNPYDTGGTHNEADGFHFCDEYFGHNGRTGGGLFILKDFQGTKEKVDVVAGLKVPAGMVNAGQTLSSGTFLSPDLSFDGKTVVFAWSSGGSEKWQAKNRFHLFKVDIDGKNLVQLTDGNFDDMHPAWMPNGRIIFISTRRGGFGRCHGRPVPSYTLYSMKADGSDIIRLSYHETNEFHPQIANDGRIIFTRWDYVDRDFNAAHHLWICNPDGSNPRAWGGNYCGPMDTLGSGPWTDGRYQERPFAEYYGRSIPGSATKFVATAGPHHGEAYGTLIIRDYSKVDDNQMSQVTKLTPEVGFPEARGGTLSYGPAYPLSETLFLTSFDNKMVLLDTSVKPAKKTEIYATKDLSTRPLYAQPVMARTPPPIIAETTFQGERWSPSVPPATVQIANVYTTDTYGKLPADVKIKSLRVVQVLPKTTQLADDPRVGYSSQNVVKMALGTVPVEEDGSAFFEAPIEREILFQVLDERGMAVQTMRSGTFLHPGENMTCVGCHEDKWNTPPPSGTPTASKRPASKLELELGRIEPINYARTIKPILTKCYACHAGKTGSPPTDTAYNQQEKYAFYFMSAGSNTVAGHGGSRSKPGQIGARGSRMGKALMSNTHKQALTDGKFTETEARTIIQWLDLGSDELGAFDNAAAQKQGQLVWPTMDVDKNDPQGFKYSCEGRPCGTGTGGTGGTRASSSAQGTGGTGGSTTPVGGNQTGVGGSKATTTSSPSGGAAGGSTTTNISRPSGGSSAAGSKATSSSSSGGAGGESSNGSGAQGGQAGSDSASKGGSPSDGSGAIGRSSASNPSSAAAQTSSGGCSMGTESRAPAHTLVLFVIGMALLLRTRRKP